MIDPTTGDKRTITNVVIDPSNATDSAQMDQVKASILLESSQAMLMQANKLPQSVLQLLS